MTFEEREQIFSKETLTIDDVSKLFDISYQKAREIVQNIRLSFPHSGAILPVGQCLIDDYIKYFKISRTERYSRKLNTKDSDHSKTGITKEDTKPHYFSVMNAKQI